MMTQPEGYPFILSEPSINILTEDTDDKGLGFFHNAINETEINRKGFGKIENVLHLVKDDGRDNPY